MIKAFEGAKAYHLYVGAAKKGCLSPISGPDRCPQIDRLDPCDLWNVTAQSVPLRLGTKGDRRETDLIADGLAVHLRRTQVNPAKGAVDVLYLNHASV